MGAHEDARTSLSRDLAAYDFVAEAAPAIKDTEAGHGIQAGGNSAFDGAIQFGLQSSACLPKAAGRRAARIKGLLMLREEEDSFEVKQLSDVESWDTKSSDTE